MENKPHDSIGSTTNEEPRRKTDEEIVASVFAETAAIEAGLRPEPAGLLALEAIRGLHDDFGHEESD